MSCPSKPAVVTFCGKGPGNPRTRAALLALVDATVEFASRDLLLCAGCRRSFARGEHDCGGCLARRAFERTWQ